MSEVVRSLGALAANSRLSFRRAPTQTQQPVRSARLIPRDVGGAKLHVRAAFQAPADAEGQREQGPLVLLGGCPPARRPAAADRPQCSSGGCKHFAWDDATPRDQTWSPYAAAAPAPGYAAQAPSASGETNRPIYDASARGRGGYSNRGRGGGSGGPQGGAARPWGSGPGHGAASPAKAFNPSAVPVEVIFSIFDSDRIGVKFPINDTVNRWLRDRLGQGGMRWDSDTKLWIFDQSKYEEIANAMEDELSDRVNISITRIPKFAYSLYKRGRERMVINPEERERINQSMARNLPKDLFETLLPFQRAGVRKAIENEGRVFICDEMGLGKTIQALSVLAFYRPQWPALIICPSSLRYTWKNEIKRWLKLEDDDIQVITTGKDRIDDRKRMTIISYDLAAKTEISNELTNLAFDCVVADESHNLKSKDSKRTMAITPLLQQAKRAILLSGTPALSRPIELYPQLACLKPDLFTSFSAFGDRYCDPRPARFSRGMEYKGSSYLTELHWILDKTVLVRRLKKDVLKELPEKRRQCIMVEVPASNREALSKKLGDLQRLEEMKRGMAGRGGNDGKIRGIESQCRALYTELVSSLAIRYSIGANRRISCSIP